MMRVPPGEVPMLTRTAYRRKDRLKRVYLAAVVALILFGRLTPAAALSWKAVPAKAAVVMDSSGAVLYAKYPNAKLAPASTVKLVTAMVALDRLDPAMKVKISRNAAAVRSLQPRLCPDDQGALSRIRPQPASAGPDVFRDGPRRRPLILRLKNRHLEAFMILFAHEETAQKMGLLDFAAKRRKKHKRNIKNFIVHFALLCG